MAGEKDRKKVQVRETKAVRLRLVFQYMMCIRGGEPIWVVNRVSTRNE